MNIAAAGGIAPLVALARAGPPKQKKNEASALRHDVKVIRLIIMIIVILVIILIIMISRHHGTRRRARC